MKKIRQLGFGDKFRPAHPQQISENRRPMSRDVVYKITKVFPQAPYFSIAVEVKKKEGGVFSLAPDVPIISEREPAPSLDQIFKFLGVSTRKKVIGYRVMWDGRAESLFAKPNSHLVNLIKTLKVFGKTEYSVEEVRDVLNENFKRFNPRPLRYSPYEIFQMNKKALVRLLLIEEIVDYSEVPAPLKKANLLEVEG